MARQRRTLDEHIAELATRGRSERYGVLSTPAMSSIGGDLIDNDAITSDHLGPGAVRLDNLDKEIADDLAMKDDLLRGVGSDLIELENSLNEARREVVDIDGRLDKAADSLYEHSKRIDDEIIPAIDDAAASPITDARLTAGSLTKWPFKSQIVPAGAIIPGAVGSKELADFSLVAKKFNDDRHRLY